MAHIVGISGKAGSGKDTVAKYLVDNHGFIAMSLADEMKRFGKRIFGFTDNQLWGPSANRNAIDERYCTHMSWDEAEAKLEKEGLAWCKFLFPNGDVQPHFLALVEWFSVLRAQYGCDWGQKGSLSPRVMLQTIGTEFGRTRNENVWIDATTAIAKLVLNVPMGYVYTRENGLVKLAVIDKRPLEEVLHTYPAGVVIADVRFRNEIHGVQAAGGKVIRVKRDGAVLGQVGVANHPSESEMDNIQDDCFDYVLNSPEGLEYLHLHLNGFFPRILETLS